jgi:hypothetical protein
LRQTQDSVRTFIGIATIVGTIVGIAAIVPATIVGIAAIVAGSTSGIAIAATTPGIAASPWRHTGTYSHASRRTYRHTFSHRRLVSPKQPGQLQQDGIVAVVRVGVTRNNWATYSKMGSSLSYAQLSSSG